MARRIFMLTGISAAIDFCEVKTCTFPIADHLLARYSVNLSLLLSQPRMFCVGDGCAMRISHP